MWLAAKRRKRDRQFVPFDRDRLFVRAFAAAAANLSSWDLFPPVQGYRPYSASTPRSHLYSAQRQHADWSSLVLQRDRRVCQECSATEHLEAHHLWPQSGFPSLRYVLKNGRTLCRKCHDAVEVAREITPQQFEILTNEQTMINANVCAAAYWSYFMGPLEKGRLSAYGLHEEGSALFPEEEARYEEWAALNAFHERIRTAATRSPLACTDLQAQLRLTL